MKRALAYTAALAVLFSMGVAFLRAQTSGGAVKPPSHSIHAIRYASVPGFPLSGLVMGAPRGERVDIAMIVWLIRGEGRTILFDSGFHRAKWIEQFEVTDFLSPDAAVREAGVDPARVTDLCDGVAP